MAALALVATGLIVALTFIWVQLASSKGAHLAPTATRQHAVGASVSERGP